INSLYDLGARVINSDERHIHVSGHPGKTDLSMLYEKFSPHYAFPIHGETEFLHHHSNWINEYFPEISTTVIKNFESIIIDKDKISFESIENSPEPILIHGQDIPIEKSAISQRRKM